MFYICSIIYLLFFRKFHRGTKVKLQLNELEMSSSFLGSSKHVTLLEADATLIGLHKKPPELKQ